MAATNKKTKASPELLLALKAIEKTEFAPIKLSLWQPIETAPKDGRMILLYRPTGGGWMNTATGSWNDDRYAKNPRPYWESWLRIGVDWRTLPPTHWMPLPEPPAA